MGPTVRIKMFLLLIVITIVPGYANARAPSNSEDVAKNMEVTLQANITSGQASFLTDRNYSTCVRTTEDKGATIILDLLKSYNITGITLTADVTAPKNSTLRQQDLIASDLYVGGGKDDIKAICNFYAPGQVVYEDFVKCFKPEPGRFVRLTHDRPGGIYLCEVQVHVCTSGYFGPMCESNCHCWNNVSCGNVDGQCPGKCAAGYNGTGCQNQCPSGSFGPDCEKQCHCAYNIDCDRESGTCSGGCAQGWHSNDCQIAVPQLSSPPNATKITYNSITLKWLAWDQPVTGGYSICYAIEMDEKFINGSSSGWKDANVGCIPNPTSQALVETTVQNLKLNTRYSFKVVPHLKTPQGTDITGGTLMHTEFIKTVCIAPTNPHIENIMIWPEAASNGKVKVKVEWKLIQGRDINCDGILYYRIFYSSQTSVWVDVKAVATQNYIVLEMDANTIYQIMLRAENNERMESNSPVETFDTASAAVVPPDNGDKDSTTSNKGLVIGVVVASLVAIVVIALLVLLLVRRNRRRKQYPPEHNLQNGKQGSEKLLMTAMSLDNETVKASDSTPITLSPAPARADTTPYNSLKRVSVPTANKSRPSLDHKAIRVEELEQYVMERRDNDCEELRREYKEFPDGLQYPCEVGKHPNNRLKNRFINIIAYDHSRVKLDPASEDPDSDYINANYIDGYKKPHFYIATQGCNKWTIQDIWKLTWKEKSGRIVMVTNLVESGKRKCEQYWPEQMNVDKPYDTLHVKWIDTEQTSDFVIRTFILRKGSEERGIKQFHFTAWPDHGVPTRAAPILAFRKKVRSFDESHPGAMIVHCSAGVGRTGTFIAVDYLLEQAEKEKQVDLFALTKKMRKDRVNMIQTEEQYIFVYDALLEALQTGDTAIACSEFRAAYEALLKEVEVEESTANSSMMDSSDEPLLNTSRTVRKSKLQIQFENLEAMRPKLKDEDLAGKRPENINKNRNPDLIPSDRHRPFLNTAVKGTNDYVNAVYVDGYKSRNAHIITQLPVPNTVIDFWRLVYEHKVGCIVKLNQLDPTDDTQVPYWSDETASQCGPFLIEPLELDNSNVDIILHKFTLTYQPQNTNFPRRLDSKDREVHLFEFQAWPNNSDIPTNKNALLGLFELVEKAQYQTGGGPVLIHCLDGVRQSGLFTALSCIWEKMKVDQEVDIFHTVRHLQYHLPTVLGSLEQYKYCFEMVLAYLAEFETYANFM